MKKIKAATYNKQLIIFFPVFLGNLKNGIDPVQVYVARNGALLLHGRLTLHDKLLLRPRSRTSGVARGCILDKLYVIDFLNCFEQPLLGYIAYLLIVNHLTV